MPIIDAPRQEMSLLNPPEGSRPKPLSYHEIYSAAFELENDVQNAIELASKPTFSVDPSFDWIKKLRESPYWEDYRDNFIGTRSEEEYNYRVGQIETERKNREILNRSGWAGFVASMAAGTASPTVFLPLAGQGRGVKAFFEAAVWGLTGAAIQELPLIANQQTRTAEDVAISLGASTILSGTLGGAISMLRPREAQVLANSMYDGGPPLTIHSQSVGAAATRAEYAGKIDPGVFGSAGGLIRALDTNAATRSPVTSTLSGESPQASFLMAQHADAGLSLEGNAAGIPTSPGGTIENAIKLHNRKFQEAVESIDSEYANYVFSQSPPKIGGNTAAAIKGYFSKAFMDKTTFRKEVGRAMFSGDEHENEFVRKVAAKVRKDVYEPTLKQMQEVGLLTSEVNALGDPSYLNRLYDTDLIKGGRKNEQGLGFAEVLKLEFQQKLHEDFSERLLKFQESQAQREELLTDVARPENEIKQLREDFLSELKGYEEDLPENIAEIEDKIASLRAQARSLRDAPKQANFDPNKVRRELLKDARDMDKSLRESSEFYKGVPETRARLRRRLRNLNKAQVVLEKSHAKKLEKIERAEELSENSLMRVARAGKRILNGLDKWTDDVLEEKLGELHSQFGETARLYDKGETQIAKLSRDEDELRTLHETRGSLPDDDQFDVTGYHGTNEVIDQFEPSATRLDRGVFFSDDPALASDFAMGKRTGGDPFSFPEDADFRDKIGPLLSKADEADFNKTYTEFRQLTEEAKNVGNDAVDKRLHELYTKLITTAKDVTSYIDPDTLLPTKGPNVSKMRLKLGKNYVVDMGEEFDWDKEAEAIAFAREGGYDSVTFTLSGKKGNEKYYSILNRENIRGPRGRDDIPDPLLNQMVATEQRQRVRAERMTKLSGAIADAENTTDREIVRDTMRAVLSETMARVSDINARRAVRTERLRAQAAKMAPEDIDTRVRAIRDEGDARAASFNESIRNMGAESFDPIARSADFARFAEESALAVQNKILGTFLRLPMVDVLQDKRGAQLARVLDIPSSKLLPWLETDIEKLVRSHVMTMAPDIEIARKFQGSVNMDEILAPMWDEMERAKKAVETKRKGKKVNEDGTVGRELTSQEKERETARIHETYQMYKDNLIAVHERLRHSFGLPKDPDGVAYRLGKFASNANVLRYMGMVTVSSIPDVLAPVTKYGLTHVFKHAFVPLVTNLKAFKMSAREARYAGVANDAVLSTRAQSVLDITEDLRRGSKFERGVEHLTNKQGVLALFNLWTDGMKQWMAVATNAQLMDSIGRVINGQDAKASRYLASVGIGEKEALRIWDAAQNGGAQKVSGTWLPNTENWIDLEAQRFYRTALAREIDRGVVTPGVERPLWTNATQMGRLISQFKSFAFASTYRTMLAGLQQRDAAYLTGTMGSLAFGALSYYLYGLSAGGNAYEEMQNASIGRWSDEAMQRSGMLAVFGLGQDLLSRVPLTSNYSSFSGARTTRRGGDDLYETILGPTFGDLIPKTLDIATEIDDPTQGTVHKFRTLLPWQNLVWLRQILDQVEQSMPVPERRGQ